MFTLALRFIFLCGTGVVSILLISPSPIWLPLTFPVMDFVHFVFWIVLSLYGHVSLSYRFVDILKTTKIVFFAQKCSGLSLHQQKFGICVIWVPGHIGSQNN